MGNKKIYIRFSAIMFFFFLSWAASYKMISIWLGQTIHLNGASIGFFVQYQWNFYVGYAAVIRLYFR